MLKSKPPKKSNLRRHSKLDHTEIARNKNRVSKAEFDTLMEEFEDINNYNLNKSEENERS